MKDADMLPRTERLLVVEDDGFSQELIELYLRKAGFADITVAADGREALDLAKQRPFDLVLLDLNIPRIRGAEVLRRLRKEGYLTGTPVIVSSSITNMEDIVQCLDLGADDFLPKPFNVRLLENRVSACLEKKRLLDHGRAELQRQDRNRHAARALNTALSALSLPAGCGWSARAQTLPGRSSGGCAHTILPLDDHSAFLLAAGVTQDGIAADLTLARILALGRNILDRLRIEGGQAEPHAVLSWINRELCQDPAGPVTLLAATLSPHHLTLANAGAPDPLIASARDGIKPAGTLRGRPLGLHPDASYSPLSLPLAAGDALVVYSRSLTDITDSTGHPFGDQRLINTLTTCPTFQPDTMLPTLSDDLSRCLGQRTPAEDVALLVCGVMEGAVT